MPTHHADAAPPRTPAPRAHARNEALAWVSAALRNERLLRRLETRDPRASR